MARNKDDTDRHDSRGRKPEKKPEEEEEEAQGEEGESEQGKVRQVAGNSFAADAAEQSTSIDGGMDRASAYQKGTPDEGDPEDGPAAQAMGESEDLDTLMFGDPGWVPPPVANVPMPQVSQWVEDLVADWRVRGERLSQMRENADAGPVVARGPTWTPDVVHEHAAGWAARVGTMLPDSPIAQTVAWWLETGTGSVPGPPGRLRRELRAMALGSLALRAFLARLRPGTEDVAVALPVLRVRIDRLEHQLATGPATLHSAAELLAERWVETDDPVAPLEDDPDESLARWWEATLALRPGELWRDHGAAPELTPRSRFPLPQAVDPVRLRREQLANLGIGLFREIIRQRVRVAGAIGVLLDVSAAQWGSRLHPELRGLALAVDGETADALGVLRALGRGLQRPPFISDAQARELLEQVIGRVDAVRVAVAWDLARWTSILLDGGLLVDPPRAAHPIVRALRQGRPDRVRGELTGPAAALLPPLEVDRLLAACDAWRSEGHPALAAMAGVLGGPAALDAGRTEDALYLAELGIALGFELGDLALIADAVLRSADALHARGDAAGAESMLVELGAILVGAGGDALAERVATWVPRA